MTRDPESSVLRLPATVYEEILKRKKEDMVLEVAANREADAILTHEQRGFDREEYLEGESSARLAGQVQACTLAGAG